MGVRAAYFFLSRKSNFIDPQKMALQYADRLGCVLNQEEPQLLSVRELLSAVEQDGSPEEAKHVVNYPLQKHGGRTSVHLAAGSGLWECLELLLKKGGGPGRKMVK